MGANCCFGGFQMKSPLSVKHKTRDYRFKKNLPETVLDFIPTYWTFKTVFIRAGINFLRNKPFSASFDITSKCNCRCIYCYYYNNPNTPKTEKLTDNELLDFIKKVCKNIPIVHATFIGGEPTLRPRVLEEAIEYFPHSWVITNGIKGFSIGKPSCWVWSVDGPQSIHNQIKGCLPNGKIRDVWSRSIKYLESASAPVITNTNINKLTSNHLGEFVAEMSKTSIRGMVLSFYTQIKGQNHQLALTDHERKKVLYELSTLRKEYPNFILTTSHMAHYFTPGTGLNAWNSPQLCPVACYSRAFTSNGTMQEKCAMGESSDCHRCGCGMGPIFNSLTRLDWRTWKWILTVL